MASYVPYPVHLKRFKKNRTIDKACRFDYDGIDIALILRAGWNSPPAVSRFPGEPASAPFNAKGGQQTW